MTPSHEPPEQASTETQKGCLMTEIKQNCMAPLSRSTSRWVGPPSENWSGFPDNNSQVIAAPSVSKKVLQSWGRKRERGLTSQGSNYSLTPHGENTCI